MIKSSVLLVAVCLLFAQVTYAQSIGNSGLPSGVAMATLKNGSEVEIACPYNAEDLKTANFQPILAGCTNGTLVLLSRICIASVFRQARQPFPVKKCTLL